MSIRRRTLNISDVYWYALRAMLAATIGYFFSQTISGLGASVTDVGAAASQAAGASGASAATAASAASGATAASSAAAGIAAAKTHPWTDFVAFAIMVLPVDVLMKQIRRVGYLWLSTDQKEEEGDQLLSLAGVTTPIVALLLAEGVYSIEQIATADPILLSIRTGLPFRFVLRLGSQAIVRRHLGDSAKYLSAIGYCDAVSIWYLCDNANERPDEFKAVCKQIGNILSNQSGLTVNPEIVVSQLRAIAGEEYTRMLAKICPVNPPVFDLSGVTSP